MNYEKMSLNELKENLKKEYPITLTNEEKQKVLESMNQNIKSTLINFNRDLLIYGCVDETKEGNIGVVCSKCEQVDILENQYTDHFCKNCNSNLDLRYNNSIHSTSIHLYHKDKNIYSIHSVSGNYVIEGNDIKCDNLNISDAFGVWYIDERGFFYNIKGLNQINSEKSINNDIRGFKARGLNIVIGFEDIPSKTIDYINSLLDITNYPNLKEVNFIDTIKVAAGNIVKLDIIKKQDSKKEKKQSLLDKLNKYIRTPEELFDMTNLCDKKLINSTHTHIGNESEMYFHCPKCNVVNNIKLTVGARTFVSTCCGSEYETFKLNSEREIHRYAIEEIVKVEGVYYRLNTVVSARINDQGELSIKNYLDSVEKLVKLRDANSKESLSNKVFRNNFLYKNDKAPLSLERVLMTKESIFNILDFFEIKDQEVVYDLVYKQFEVKTYQEEHILLNKNGVFNHMINKTLFYYPNVVDTIGLERLCNLHHSDLNALILYPDKENKDIKSITGLSKDIFEAIYEKGLDQIMSTVCKINAINPLNLDDLDVLRENIHLMIPLEENDYVGKRHFFNILKILKDHKEYNLKRVFNRFNYYIEEESLKAEGYHYSLFSYYGRYLEDLTTNIYTGSIEANSDLFYPQNLKLNMHKQENLRSINNSISYDEKQFLYEEDEYVIKSISNTKHAMSIEKEFTKPFAFLMLDNDYSNLFYLSKDEEVIAILVGSYPHFSTFKLIRTIPKNHLTKKDRIIIDNFTEFYKGDM